MNTIATKALEWLIVGVLLAGVLYAATTAWKNEEKLLVVGEDVKSIKRSLLALVLDAEPDKSSIAKELVSDATLLKGVESFKAGEFRQAYEEWEAAARKGDRDSVYAIAVANDALRLKLERTDLSEAQRREIRSALQVAPKIREEDGVYVLPRKMDN